MQHRNALAPRAVAEGPSSGAYREYVRLSDEIRRLRRPPRRRRTYSWALRVQGGGPGYAWALELAENARERREAQPRGWVPPRLTQADIARREGVSPAVVSREIERERQRHFGDVSDSAVYRQLKRRKEIAAEEPRECAAPDCSELIPPGSRRSREFHHPRCRVRSHQQKRRRSDRT